MPTGFTIQYVHGSRFVLETALPLHNGVKKKFILFRALFILNIFKCCLHIFLLIGLTNKYVSLVTVVLRSCTIVGFDMIFYGFLKLLSLLTFKLHIQINI